MHVYACHINTLSLESQCIPSQGYTRSSEYHIKSIVVTRIHHTEYFNYTEIRRSTCYLSYMYIRLCVQYDFQSLEVESLLLPFVCLSVSQNCSSIRFANKNSVCYAILTTTNTFFRDTRSQNSLSFQYRYCPLSCKKYASRTIFAFSV